MLTQAWSNNFLIFKSFIIILSLVVFSSCDFISNRIRAKPIVQIEKHQLSTQNFSKELATKLKKLDSLSAKDPKILSVYKEQIINDFIITSLVNLWYEENMISISKSDLDEEIRSIVSTYPSDSVFKELLITSELSYAEWVTKVESGLKKKKLLIILTKDSPQISEDELLSYYNENRSKYEQAESILLAHIVVTDNNQAEIIKKLLVKQRFTDVAKKYSPSFNSESQDVYGWVEKNYSLGLEKYFKLHPGEIFGPITLEDGMHIFKIIEKKPFKSKSFSEVRSQVLTEVLNLRETAKFYSWLDVQLKRYKVKKNVNVINSIYVETK